MILRNATFVAAMVAVGFMSPGANGAVTTTVVDVPTRGVTQRILHLRPDAPKANIVSIPGGDGVYGIREDGTMSSQTARCGPVSRNRQDFADRGFGVALVDKASDGAVYRIADALEVVRYLRARDAVPIWVIGGSNSTEAVALLAASLPAGDPVGVIFFSPQNLQASQAQAIARPALVVYHPGDAGQFGPAVFQALTSAPVKELRAVTGGSNVDCGFHLFSGADAQFVATTTGFIDQHNGSLASATNYQGLWWNAAEPGWGINLAHQGDQIYLTWYTYDASGRASWLAMLAAKSAPDTYSGTIVEVRGPAFSAVPFAPAVVSNAVGNGTLTFSDTGSGTFAYTAKSVTQTKAITRFVFGPQPTCSYGASPDFIAATNYQDLWWNAAEPGWGINLTHQGGQIYATWYTYDVDGSPLWLAALMTATGAGAYSGPLLRYTGPPFSSTPFAPPASATNVGNATLSFANGNAATWSYTVGATSGSKPMSRFLFAAPAGTPCQ